MRGLKRLGALARLLCSDEGASSLYRLALAWCAAAGFALPASAQVEVPRVLVWLQTWSRDSGDPYDDSLGNALGVRDLAGAAKP
jgi:hypothetical protein